MILCRKNAGGWIMRRMRAIWVSQEICVGRRLTSAETISGNSGFLSVFISSYWKVYHALVKLKDLGRGYSFLSQDTSPSTPMRKESIGTCTIIPVSYKSSKQSWWLAIFTRLQSRRVVLCLVMVYVCSYVSSLIQPRVFNIFWPNLKYRKKKVLRRF